MSPTIDYAKQLRDIIANDPIQTAMMNGTFNWASTLVEPKWTEEDHINFKRLQKEAMKRIEEDKKKRDEALALAETEWLKEAEEDVKYVTSLWASEEYWIKNHCTCSMEDIETHVEELGNPCKCFQKIHLDENGEPEECRFFNSPCGCRDGDACIYKHTERDPATIACRFELTDVGCNPGFGRKCPYMHTKPQVPIGEIMCKFNFKCKPRKGAPCPYKHGFC